MSKRPPKLASKTAAKPAAGDSLTGQLLIAMPGMEDPRFDRSVIFICAHTEEGAMGLMLNKPAEGIAFPELLKQLEISGASPRGDIPVLVGGPVETGRGFVLHSADYAAEDATLQVNEQIGLTATLDILRAAADGAGPRKAVLALGYSGWGPGQLEGEIQRNGWLTCPADDAILFDDDAESKWARALRKIGADPSHLSRDAGHA